jgi:molybdopterin-guanine dinucleotide biosynthesis protein A
MTKEVPRLSAAVLAGGKSTRMGTDKALLPVIDGGPPLLELVLRRVRKIADDVMIVAGDRRYDAIGPRVVNDQLRGGGALAGIHAAIAAARHEHCLIVACDMPFLSAALLARLAAEPRDYDILIPRLPGESRQRGRGLVFQTLHAIYGKRCLPAIEASVRDGNRQVIGFFGMVRVRAIEVDEVRRFDPMLESFYNANTQEALTAARDIYHRLERAS